MLGRKLDIVCSTQPYGKEVRYSSAANSEPASGGETRNEMDRDCGCTLSGKMRSKAADPPAGSEPPWARESLTPGTFTGRSSWSASDSSSVRALPVMLAVRTGAARTRQSTLASPRLGICTSLVAPSRISKTARVSLDVTGLEILQSATKTLEK